MPTVNRNDNAGKRPAEARGTAVSAFAPALFLGQTFGSLAFAVVLATVGYRPGFPAAALGVAAPSLYGRSGLR